MFRRRPTSATAGTRLFGYQTVLNGTHPGSRSQCSLPPVPPVPPARGQGLGRRVAPSEVEVLREKTGGEPSVVRRGPLLTPPQTQSGKASGAPGGAGAKGMGTRAGRVSARCATRRSSTVSRRAVAASASRTRRLGSPSFRNPGTLATPSKTLALARRFSRARDPLFPCAPVAARSPRRTGPGPAAKGMGATGARGLWVRPARRGVDSCAGRPWRCRRPSPSPR